MLLSTKIRNNLRTWTFIFISFFFTFSDHYVATVTWATNESLAVQWLNRTQNCLILQMYKHAGSEWNSNKVNMQGRACVIVLSRQEQNVVKDMTVMEKDNRNKISFMQAL